MEDTMEEENGREAKLKAEITRWLIFFGVAIMLSVMTWLGWSLTNRKNPITSFTTLVSDSSVAIGIQGSAPESLDIRTEQGTALEQALLENVYETLVSRSETNKLQPSIAKSWQISDDGLTYTFTLNSNMTFANGQAQLVTLKAVSGNWVFHCHILEHMDTGLMGWFRVS